MNEIQNLLNVLRSLIQYNIDDVPPVSLFWRSGAPCEFFWLEKLEKGRFGYSLKADEGELVLSISISHPKEYEDLEGIKHKEMTWDEIARAVFSPGVKEPVFLGEWSFFSTGRSYRGTPVFLVDKEAVLDEVVRYIEKGAFVNLERKTPLTEIRKVFPWIIDIYSLRMFFFIYQHKGYSFKQAEPKEAVRRLLTEEFDIEDYRVSPVCLMAELERDAGKEGRQALRFYSEMEEACKENEATVCTGALHNLLLLHATIHFVPGDGEKREDRYFLRVAGKKGPETVVFLFSHSYAACSRSVKLMEYFSLPCELTGSSVQAVRAFDRICPDFHLMQYLENSHNILVPMLSGDYHAGIELAAKAGAAGLAERIEEFYSPSDRFDTFVNLKEMFGLPVYAVRGIPKELASSENRTSLIKLWFIKPEYLRVRRFTGSFFDFCEREKKELDQMDDEADARRKSPMNRQEKELAAVLHYLEEHPGNMDLYFRYLSVCRDIGEYVQGVAPSRDLRDSYLRALLVSRKRRFDYDSEWYPDGEYLQLTTCLSVEDTEFFNADPFIISAPFTLRDIVKEGEKMHNCVGDYCESVKDGSTKIYFLRKKNKPDKSHGTIEVCNDALVQAKGKCNDDLPVAEQLFIRKWCDRKKIVIDTYDLDATDLDGTG